MNKTITLDKHATVTYILNELHLYMYTGREHLLYPTPDGSLKVQTQHTYTDAPRHTTDRDRVYGRRLRSLSLHEHLPGNMRSLLPSLTRQDCVDMYL